MGLEGNQSLNRASVAKKDEFYTQLSDIEKELRHYRKHFQGKSVLCNCDDPYESNFFKYFVLNFNRLGLKKLIATGYAGSPVAGTQLDLFDADRNNEKAAAKPYMATVTSVRDATGNGALDMQDIAELIRLGEIPTTQLEGDGDFRSRECLKLVDEVDIVVTNPPFSLFREYVAMLVEHGKEFVIIGNQNAITYKEIFPLLMSNKVWLGYHSGHTLFAVPETYQVPEFYDINDKKKLRSNGYIFDDDGKLWRNLGNICWFTNLDIKKRHEELILVPRYDPERYPKYDNYDAIEVSKVADIPCDYEPGYLVPIEYKQQLLDAEEFVLGSERKNSKGQMCVCVCGHASSSAFTDNATSSSDGALQRPNGSADHLSGEVQSETIRDSGSGLQAGTSNHSQWQDEAKSAEDVCEWEEALFSRLDTPEDAEWCNGVMGVPITYLEKYNPEQFTIVGATESEGKGFSNGLWYESSDVAQPLVNQKRKYKRIFIKRRCAYRR